MLKYTFKAGKKPDTFSGALKSDGQEKSGGKVVGTPDQVAAGNLSATLDFTNALGLVTGAKYARFYLVKDGEAVDPTGKLTVTGGTAGPDPEHGYYIYKSAGLSGTDLSVSLTLTTAELDAYQVIGVFSTGDAPSDDPLKESDWDLKYTYTFEYPFKGDATSATAVAKSYQLTESKKSETLTLAFDFASNKIKLLDGSDNEIGSEDMDGSWSSISSGGTLNSGQKFYVRWFLEKAGAETYIAGAVNDAGTSYSVPAKERYGLYYQSDGGVSLGNVMKIKLDGSKLSELTNYNLVCTIATNLDGETFDASSKLTHEPSTMAMKYTISFTDAPWEAQNLSTVKTVYKTALYDKATGNITPDLFTDYPEILGDLSTSIDDFRTNGYLRWYVVDAAGDLVVDMEDWGFTATQTYTKNNTYGHYILPDLYDYNKTSFNPTITLPSSYDKNTAYKNYKVVCVVTNDRTGMSLPDCEPTTMQVKYVFNLILTAEEFAALPFVHYKGQSGRDWIVPDGSTGSQAQKYWDNTTGEAKDITDDIRQGVHTWEYNVYILPGEERTLILPFENYTSTGNNLEPRGYIRWYDWKTDTKVVDKTTESSKKYTFKKVGTALSSADRGLFGLCISGNPTHANVGVTFTPDADFTESIDIACDVSKYSDGITTIGSTSYLIHEPTLSNRYIFHIYPASIIAGKLATAKTELATGKDAAISTGKISSLEPYMVKVPEDKGKMVVSLGTDKEGSFALRMDEHSIANYILQSGSSYVTPTKVKWYSYVEKGGKVYYKKINVSDNSDRITTFTFDNFKGSYTELGGTGTVIDPDASKYHVIAYVGGDSYDVVAGTGDYAPVAHYELYFIEAPAIPVANLKNLAADDKNINRTDGYMMYHYHRAGIVDFDGNPETDSRVTDETKDEYYSTENWYDAPTSSANNMTWMPREWSDIEYGFSYPQLTSTIKNGYGGTLWLSPEHGDYIMLKSMNVSGISSDLNTPPHYYHWWDSNELYDYTHTYTDNTKYGSFLYTDASDESRSIATIPFTGSLCSGSSLYFTAAVADMTSGTIKPQLVVRIYSVDEDGNRTPVVAFHTCDISTTGAETGKWNQVYGQSTVPLGFDDSSTSYIAEVINYANNTNGADFAIDQIAIYINTAKIQAVQSSTLCDESNKVKVRVFADAENLINTVGAGNTKTIYYRLFERISDDNHVIREKEALKGVGVYSDDTSKPSGYGVVEFTASYDISTLTKTVPAESGFYLAEDGTVMYQLANREFVLDPTKIYFASVYTLTSEKPGDTVGEEGEAAGWGNPYSGNQCTVYSGDINPQKIYLRLKEGEAESDGSVAIGCGSTSITKTFDLTLKYPITTGGHEDVEGITFDFFLGDRATYKAAKDDGITYLADAVAGLRTKTQAAISSSSDLPTDYDPNYTEAMHDLLATYLGNGTLLLSATNQFTHTFNTAGEKIFMAIPLQQHLPGDATKLICSPINLIFNVTTGGGGPKMTIGFDDVDYSQAPEKRGIRVGLEQLAKMRLATDNYRLHIPVCDYEDKNQAKENAIHFSDGYLFVSETNDPTVELNKKVAKIVPSDDGTTAFVNKNYMYLTLDLSGGNCEVTFNEGFYYEVTTRYYDATEDAEAEADRCNSDLYMVFKIVPEFVTWEGQQIGSTSFYNVNWNNDGNWNRSTRAELYKGASLGSQNTATDGHLNGYFNNEEISTSLTTHYGYVPMKFTYVTLPTNNHAPDLNSMTYETTGGSQTGGYLINLANTLITNTSPVGTHLYNSESTVGIRYELLVRYGTHADGGEGCFGHRYLDGTTWTDGTAVTGNVFDCEKFDGNWCREIYFKPGAELLQQQRLRYQKAWVEKELEAGKWYLMSSPLKGTYAGDMYVPTVMSDLSMATPANVSGRQVTEAFQSITFGDGTGLYSRTKYPVYQRSWGLATAKVYTKVNDIRATDYSARLNFGTLSTDIVEWSHTYNDVQVPYNTIGGFSIRAHKKDQTLPALIRLPKDDTTYNYFEWNGTGSPEPAAGIDIKSTPKGSDVLGQFVYDRTSADQEKVEFNLSDMQSQGADAGGNTYYLVGNPFMGSIDMGLFFAQNTAFGSIYYTYEAGVLTTVDASATPTESNKHIIKPLQAFFVKCAAGSAPEKVIFNRSMMTDGNYEVGTTYSNNASPARPRMAMRAVNGFGSSEAVIDLDYQASADYDGSEDVETLFDSNLSDVPMVFTVAGSQAVSIDVRPSLDIVPFGVSCGGSDEPVEVTLSGIAIAEGQLYVVDAVTGETRAVSEGSTFSVQPNDYGRYFLTTRGDLTAISDATAKGIVVSVRNRQLTVRAAAPLQSVRILTVGGEAVATAVDMGTEASFNLNGAGIYVVEAQTALSQETVKVVVK